MNAAFIASVQNPAHIAKHAFSPLIRYEKTESRYKKDLKTGRRQIVHKPRPIMFASHRDACIFSYYGQLLNEALDVRLHTDGTSQNVIAYRALGRSNADFAAEAYAFAMLHAPVMILAFDVSSFFDTLDHRLLKRRVKSVLGVAELPEHWFRLLRSVTRFHFVEQDDLEAHSTFKARLADKKSRDRIATIAELKQEGLAFHPNPSFAKGGAYGIPQGTPISAVLSNVYMVDFDLAARTFCDEIGAFYRRYSDDILVICKPEDAVATEAKIMSLIASELLVINSSKTERTLFDPASTRPSGASAAQYLGFTLSEEGPAIRERSLGNQHRKLKRAFRQALRSQSWRVAHGLSATINTRKLNQRFLPLALHKEGATTPLKNFPSYVRRSSKAFGGNQKIIKQTRKLERTARRLIAELKLSSRVARSVPAP